MSPLPPSRPGDAAKPIDDFEWPPTADDLSVYEIGPDPWQTLQHASSRVFAARHGELPQPRRQPTSMAKQKLAGVLAASAIVTTVAGWVLYTASARPVAVHAVHHPAPAATAAATATPSITIVATYPVAPEPSSPAQSSPAPADPARTSGGDVAIASQPHATDQIAADPAPIGDAAPADAPTGVAPTESTPTPAPADTPAPAGPEPAGHTSDAGIRSLLQRYEEAYDRRDVRTAAALWPSLDQPALTRAFAGLDRQDVHFDSCEIDASEARGSAVCVGTVRYVPRVGRAVEKEDRITWTFDLARSGEDWRIAGLDAH